MSYQDKNIIDINHAYDAMVNFIEEYYKEWGSSSEDIETLLGGLKKGPNGSPGDPGMADQWLRSIQQTAS